jgi:hypothetical protein
MKKVIIFVDALPFDYAANSEVIKSTLADFATPIRLVPELGYSSNQHMALFTGNLPKDCGYLGDYSLDKKSLNKSFKQLMTHNSYVNYFLKRLIAVFSGEINNIPIGLGSLFINDGIYPLKDASSLIKADERYKRYQFHDVKDLLDFDSFNKNVDYSRDQFCVINQIDHAGHIYGTEGVKYHHEIDYLTSFLSKFFDKLDSDSSIVILSDHGMSNCPTKTTLDLETILGSQAANKYIYFVDSSVCKLWYFDEEIKINARKYFNSLDTGHLITNKEKEYWGITSEICDDIFVLNSDFYFEPQYFGFGLRSKTFGMHGSSPECKDQHGILISNEESDVEMMRNKEVFNWFEEHNFL